MLKEFRDFINRGSVVDLAVGVVIGAAFSAIITAFVDNIVSPIVGLILGGTDLTGLSADIGGATLGYGAFLQAVIDFILVAFVLFLFIRAYNRWQGEEEEEAGPSTEEQMLSVLERIEQNTGN